MKHAMTFTAYNLTRDRILVTQGWVAASFFARIRGLIGHEPLAVGEGLLITPCQGIHTFGMAFPIDVLYVDRSERVLRTAADIRPNRIGPISLSAQAVIELQAGMIALTGTRCDDRLLIELG